MIKVIFNYFLIASTIIGFVFILSMLCSKKGKAKSVIYLSCVVLFFTLNNLQIVLLDNFFKEANFFIRNLLLPFYLLIVPSFYTFLCHYLKIENKVTSFVFISVSLFISEIVIRLFLYQFYFDNNKNYLIGKYSQIEEIVNALFSIFLFIKCFTTLYGDAGKFQLVSTYDNLKWIKKFLFIGCLIILTWITAIVLNLDKVVNPQIFIYYPLRLSTSILLFWVGYQGFFNYSILTERIDLRILITKNEKTSTASFQPLSSAISLEFLEIEKYLITSKIYLNSEYSLEDLAKEFKMSPSKLSKIINTNTKINFSDFINKFRVEEAKKILQLDAYAHYTILSIGLECGFNSKSTFYLAFKKFTNTTPSDYRKQNS